MIEADIWLTIGEVNPADIVLGRNLAPSGTPIFSDFIHAIEILTAAQSDAAIPITSDAVAYLDNVIPAEWRTGLDIARGAPIDWAALVTPVDTVIPIEFRGAWLRDITVPTDWRAAWAVDALIPNETGLNVRPQDTAAPIAWAISIASIDDVAPIDFRATWLRDNATPVEWRTTFVSDVLMPDDAGINIRPQDVAAQIELSASPLSDAVIPDETGRSVQILEDAAAPIEWNMTRLSDVIIPTDTLLSFLLQRDIAAPIEWRTTRVADALIPDETGLDVQLLQDAVAPVEFRSGIAVSPQVFIEWRGAQAVDSVASVAAEWRGTWAVDASTWADWRGVWAVDVVTSAEWQGVRTVDAAAPAEWLISRSTTQVVAVDWAALVTPADAAMLAETGLSTRGDAAAPIDWRTAWTVDATAPIEWRTTWRVDATAFADWRGTWNVTAAVPAEWRATMRVSDATAPISFMTSTLQDSVVPGENLATALLGYEVGIDWTGAVGVVGDANAAVEWGMAAALSTASWAAWGGGVSGDRLTPTGIAAVAQGGPVAPEEVLQGTAVVSVVPAFWFGTFLGSSGALPSEWRGTPYQDATGAASWRATLQPVDLRVEIEWPAWRVLDGAVPADWQAPVARNLPVALDLTGLVVTVASDATVGLEFGLTVVGLQLISFDAGRTFAPRQTKGATAEPFPVAPKQTYREGSGSKGSTLGSR